MRINVEVKCLKPYTATLIKLSFYLVIRKGIGINSQIVYLSRIKCTRHADVTCIAITAKYKTLRSIKKQTRLSCLSDELTVNIQFDVVAVIDSSNVRPGTSCCCTIRYGYACRSGISNDYLPLRSCSI